MPTEVPEDYFSVDLPPTRMHVSSSWAVPKGCYFLSCYKSNISRVEQKVISNRGGGSMSNIDPRNPKMVENNIYTDIYLSEFSFGTRNMTSYHTGS